MPQQQIIIPSDDDSDEVDDVPRISSPKSQSSFLGTVGDLASKAYNSDFAQRLLYGPKIKRTEEEVKSLQSPEPGGLEHLPLVGDYIRRQRLQAVKDIKPGEEVKTVGPELMKVPGMDIAAERLRDVGRSSGDYWTGFRNSIMADLLEGGASGIDPRAAVLKPIPKPRVIPPPVEPLALPPTKPRLALPPATTALEETPRKPSFIAGPAGVAENRPYTVDIGPVDRPNPEGGATVLPREVEQTTPVSPTLAAGGEVGPFKKPSVLTPAQAAQQALIPNRFKTASQIAAEEVKVPGVNAPESAFYPSEKLPEQLPSAPPKLEPVPEPVSPAENPLRNVGAGVKTITRAEGLPAEVVPPLNLTPDITPKEAVQRWGWGRNAGRFSADQVRKQFGELADQPELVGKFQEGDRSGPLKAVSEYFDDRFRKLVKAGVLKPDQYKENYLKQLWENDPEEVNAVFQKNRILKHPGLSLESVFATYKEGIAAGLTPKYNNIADIAAAFEREFTNAIRDKELYKYFIDNGMLASDKALTSPFEWKLKGEGTKEAANMISNYFGKPTPGVRPLANFVTGTKNLALTQGLPFRTGQISAHGFNVLESDIMAQGFKAGLGDFFKGSINPQTDIQFMESNAPITKKLIEHGMNWADIEDHSALSSDKVSSLIDKIPGVGDLNVMRRKVFEDPLFRVHLPATKLRMAINRYQQLLPKVGETAALKGAAEFANDFAGGVDKTFRNKTLQDLARIGVLAPDWLESRWNIARKGLTGKSGYVAPLARGTVLAALPVATGIASKGVSGYLQSKPSESTGVELGQVGGKARNVEPLGTAVEPQRTALQVGTQLSQGNLGFPFRYLRNKTSPPAQALMNLAENVDPFGNPLYGKDRFGRRIPGSTAAANIGQEMIRPFTPNVIESLIDYYRGKSPVEEALTRGVGAPVNYTSEPKIKPRSSLPRLK